MTTLAPPPPAPMPAPPEPARQATGDSAGRHGSHWALLALLAGTAVLYLWGLGRSGWANAFYSAAVQAGTKSWKATFFGSFDAANFITVDKPPAALWVMDISARLFGLNSWSILVPQALEGVASVGLLYATVRRWFGTVAGCVAGAVLALTPVAALMFRYNNPDALLTLLLIAAAYAVVRAVEDGRTRWLVVAATLVGFAFLAKLLAAFIVVPVFALVYLIAAPTPLRRRLGQLAIATGALVVASLWWVIVVELIPAGSRPYIGGSQNNSLWNVMFGYNGFGRLTGNESGSVGGGPVAGSRWGLTGLTRMFNAQFGGQGSWLMPAALVLLATGLALSWRASRADRTRAALVLWGGWLVLTAAVFSFGEGIIHPYYTVAFAPAIGALIGVGGATLWAHRTHWLAPVSLAAAVGLTGIWADVLLERTPRWLPWLGPAVLVTGLVVAALVLVMGLAGLAGLPAPLGGRVRAGMSMFALAAALAVGLAGPTSYTLATVRTAYSGAIPSAGPAGSGGPGGPAAGPVGRFGGGGPGGRFRGRPSSAPVVGGPGAIGGLGGAGGAAGGFPGVGGASAAGGQGAVAGGFGGQGGFPGGGTPVRRFGGGGGAGGGLLNGSTPSAALTALLKEGSSRYTWVAATVGANDAAGYQLATRLPVMAIGGFNGTDPAPTLAEFEADVAAGRIHYFIGGGGGGLLGGGSTANPASTISSWVAAHFSPQRVDGVTLYNLG